MESGDFLNIFGRKNQQDLIMHQMCVTQIKNSTITSTFRSKKDRIAITRVEKNGEKTWKERLGVAFELKSPLFQTDIEQSKNNQDSEKDK